MFEKNKPLGITRLNVDPDVRDDLSPFDYPALSEIDTKYFSYLALNNMQLFDNIQDFLF